MTTETTTPEDRAIAALLIAHDAAHRANATTPIVDRLARALFDERPDLFDNLGRINARGRELIRRANGAETDPRAEDADKLIRAERGQAPQTPALTVDETLRALREAIGAERGNGEAWAKLDAAFEAHRQAISRAQDAEKARCPLRVVVAERTPETVLRAMLATYEAAALAWHEEGFRAGRALTSAQKRAAKLEGFIATLRRELGAIRAGWPATEMDFNSEVGLNDSNAAHLAADYEVRLSGARPIGAPPEEP